jgi:hypothetical protein
MMRPVLHTFGRALVSLLHPRMLLLTIVPFILSVLVWGVVLYFSLQPLIDWLHAYFLAHDLFRAAAGWLGAWGSGFAANVVVPLVAMWLFLPLMILTALIFIGTLAMPVIIKHVAARFHPQLERRRGGHLLGSLWRSLSSFIIFALLWTVSLPLSVIPPLGFLITPLLWGWLTYRVMVYDALAEHADREEFRLLQRRHRWPLLLIGTLTGALGAAPTLLWLGGILAVVLFPFFAAMSIWLYVLVFVFTGLWFEHYCLRALAQMRDGTAVVVADTSG